jgi:hypothetical protein
MPIVELPRAFEALGAIAAIRVLLHPAIQIELPVEASQELLRCPDLLDESSGCETKDVRCHPESHPESLHTGQQRST